MIDPASARGRRLPPPLHDASHLQAQPAIDAGRAALHTRNRCRRETGVGNIHAGSLRPRTVRSLHAQLQPPLQDDDSAVQP